MEVKGMIIFHHSTLHFTTMATNLSKQLKNTSKLRVKSLLSYLNLGIMEIKMHDNISSFYSSFCNNGYKFIKAIEQYDEAKGKIFAKLYEEVKDYNKNMARRKEERA
ncbi:hypothetical protein ACH5RR_016627 [Cinchona calisaya]|uniref:Uncharacterized protein n=1 Tax=Cinchona calisaya TaxID=153742 RepID=A0ABD2ZXN5_9GENT